MNTAKIMLGVPVILVVCVSGASVMFGSERFTDGRNELNNNNLTQKNYNKRDVISKRMTFSKGFSSGSKAYSLDLQGHKSKNSSKMNYGTEKEQTSKK